MDCSRVPELLSAYNSYRNILSEPNNNKKILLFFMLQQHDAYINAFGIIIHISHTYYSYKYIYERIYDRCEVKGAIPA